MTSQPCYTLFQYVVVKDVRASEMQFSHLSMMCCSVIAVIYCWILYFRFWISNQNTIVREVGFWICDYKVQKCDRAQFAHLCHKMFSDFLVVLRSRLFLWWKNKGTVNS